MDNQDKRTKGDGSNHGWFKAQRGENFDLLLRHHPKAFLLLALIARRARHNPDVFSPFKLEVGEALIGDFKSCGLTYKEYRTNLAKLVSFGIVATRRARRGTIAKITPLGELIFSVSPSQSKIAPKCGCEEVKYNGRQLRGAFVAGREKQKQEEEVNG